MTTPRAEAALDRNIELGFLVRDRAVAENVLRKPSRLGVPAPISKMPAALAEPEFTTAVGLIFYGHRTRLARGPQEVGLGAKLKSLFARKSG